MDKSAITLERMASFVRVAERGSMSAVAREQGVGQATITRHVAELERALGVTLLNRTTRSITLTAEGQRYRDEARTILRLVDEATDEARDAGRGVSGKLRISCTAALGIRHVCGLLFAFQDRHPGIDVDLGLSDDRIDLVREAVDLAIRLGPSADSTMQRKLVGNSRRVLVASRGYLEKRGRPHHPDDLLRHEAIRLTNVVGSDNLLLTGADGVVQTVRFGGSFETDHGLAAREAVANGRGIAASHLWLIDDLLASGTLEVVLPEFTPPSVSLSILWVPGRDRINRVRLLIDELATSLAQLPGVESP